MSNKRNTETTPTNVVRINARITPLEANILTKLIHSRGTTISHVLRELIRNSN